MKVKAKLTKFMTTEQFDHGYWYANEIKIFAKEIGINNYSKLRKDELEELIKNFLKTGKVKNSESKNVVKSGLKDLDMGLTRQLPIINYTSYRQTKQFIKTEATRLSPELKIRSGAWYRLNRWRD